MTEFIHERLEEQLKQHLGEIVPNHTARDIHAALELAGILENRGFVFKLKDLCPKKPDESMWRAIFFKDDQRFSADNPQSSVAVCMAANDALNSAQQV
jgi:DNA-directed RNA polymerase subunit F